MTVFTEAEVSKHHNVHDLWVSIRGRVYDVTGYVEDHPGGIEVLKDVAGSDGTESFEYVGHSDDAYKVLQRFQVGTLESGIEEEDAEKPSQVWDTYRAQLRSTSVKPVPSRGLWVVGFLIAAGLISHWRFQKSMPEKTVVLLASSASTTRVLSPLILVAIVTSISGYFYLYAKFTKTLHYYKEVWEYPSYFSHKVNRSNI